MIAPGNIPACAQHTLSPVQFPVHGHLRRTITERVLVQPAEDAQLRIPPAILPHVITGLHFEREVNIDPMLHHDRHHAGYVRGLNQTLAALAEARAGGDLADIKALTRALAFHGSGHVLHSLYWRSMSPQGGGRPDFVFLLPTGPRVNMDVKFPLSNYLRYLEAEGSDAEGFKRAFLNDVRGRIKEVTTREYIDTAAGTLDFVLVFIPIFIRGGLR